LDFWSCRFFKNLFFRTNFPTMFASRY